ncbi:MAG: alpha/beta fold hydrolase [Acidobacteria bacterium]|nr:MAG: alpha/beta fold hydrolase [Acidobacteriota bacterium]
MVGNVLKLGSGRSVYCLEKGTGPSLLCLHGLGGGSYFFSSLAGALADRFRTVAVDLPGCGFSPASASGFSIEGCVEILEELVRERMSEGVTILGHSMGTIIGLKLAARGSIPVFRLIFVGGLPEPIPEARKRLRERAREVRERGMAGVGDVTMPIVFSGASLRRVPDKVAMYHRLLELNDPIEYARTADALAQASARDSVPKISAPCLAVTGSEDHYAPPAFVKQFVEQLRGPVQYKEIEDCGHMPFFEKPEMFEATVRSFLESEID